MRQHFSTLVQVADAGLKDSSERVRTQALAAVATLVQWVAEEPEVKAFRTLVPSILQVCFLFTVVSEPLHKIISADTLICNAYIGQPLSSIYIKPSADQAGVSHTLCNILLSSSRSVKKGCLLACCVQMAQGGLVAKDEQVAEDACKILLDLTESACDLRGSLRCCSRIATCIQMAQAGLAAEDEQVAIDACEIFIDLIEAPAPVLGPTIPDLVRWCLQVASAVNCDLATREMALQVSFSWMYATDLHSFKMCCKLTAFTAVEGRVPRVGSVGVV